MPLLLPHPFQKETWGSWAGLAFGVTWAILSTLSVYQTVITIVREFLKVDGMPTILSVLPYVVIGLSLVFIYRNSRQWPKRLSKKTVASEVNNVAGSRQLWLTLVNKTTAPIRDVDVILLRVRDWMGRFVENTSDIQPMLVQRLPLMEPERRYGINLVDAEHEHQLEIKGHQLSTNWKPLNPPITIAILTAGFIRRATVRITFGNSCRDETFCFLWNAGSAPTLIRDPRWMRVSRLMPWKKLGQKSVL